MCVCLGTPLCVPVRKSLCVFVCFSCVCVCRDHACESVRAVPTVDSLPETQCECCAVSVIVFVCVCVFAGNQCVYI